MRPDGRRLGNRVEDRLLDVLGDPVRFVEGQVARELQVERDLRAPVDRQDVDVVDLAHARHVERGFLRTLANLGLAGRLRLDVDDDVRLGKRPPHRFLDGVCGGVSLRDGRAGRDADDDVDEVPSGRLAEPQAVKPNPRHVHANRPARRLRRIRRSAIHEDVDVAADEPAGRRHDEDGDEERGHGVTLRPAERSRRQPAEDCERPGEVAAEVERVREQRRARVAPRRPQRDGRSRQIDRDDGEHDGERPPRRIHLRLDRAR